MGRRFEAAEGWVLQSFRFGLDPSPAQVGAICRHFGARRFVYNWCVTELRAGMERFRETGEGGGAPSHYGMRKRWNRVKGRVAVDAETGVVWWSQVSKEAFSSGIRDATDAWWRWQQSRAGKLDGRRVGFPRYKKRGRDRDRWTVTTGSFGLVDRRHVKIPRVGEVRTHENMRRLDRLLGLGRARILAATVSRQGHRFFVSYRVECIRPQTNHQPGCRDSTVGVDVGIRRLATVADPDGNVLERVPNPRALETHLGELRRLNRTLARRSPGSRRYREVSQRIRKLHARVRNIRSHHIHVLTTRLAKTHGTVVVETLNTAGMLQQKGLPGARTRRRRLADAALAEIRRHLSYKCAWYGSVLVEADRWYPSTQLCSGCSHTQHIGWAQRWECESCGAVHDRDDNAALNLARYPQIVGDLSTVGAPVKRGADIRPPHQVADGEDTRKPQNGQPRDGVQAA